ncbi:MAG TPA: hypothetical protein VH375_03955, partial [Rhodanobacteraceae bacterium]
MSIDDRIAAALRLVSSQPDDAIAALRAIVADAPYRVFARHALVRALLQTGKADAAFEVARDPSVLDAPGPFGELLAEFVATSAFFQYAELLRARADRHPQDYRAALALAAVLHRVGRPSEAIEWCDTANMLRPAERKPLEIRAVSLIDRGDVERGLAAYRELLHGNEDAETAARYLVLMHYDPAQTNAGLFDALQAYASR